jgi:integrase
VLRRALKQAKWWGIVDRNVAEDVDPPRLKKGEIQPLDREQTRTLLQAAEGDRLHALYVVAVTAGLRPGEMLALRWSDVDLEAGALRINRALSGSEFAATKTPRSRRKIELSNTARAALRAHRKRQLEEQMKKAGLWKDHGLVFPSTVGSPLSHRNVVRSFKALLTRGSARRHQALRSPPYLRHAATQQQRPSEVRPGTSGARFHSANAGHLQPRAKGYGQRDW